MYAMHAQIQFFPRERGPGDTCMYSQGFRVRGGGGGGGPRQKIW